MIEEGRAKIFLEDFTSFRGPGKKKPGFYNPSFSLDRDIQLLFCQYAVNNGARKILDSMAATGIRGIRMAKEVEGEKEVEINDVNPESYEIIRKNVEINGVEVKIFNKNICSLLQERKYDYIDLDPYGSPIPFIPCLFSGMKKRSYVSISATDTATLCGANRRTCIRKYHAIPVEGHARKEGGLRILMGYIARQASSYDYGFIPILSYSRGHYFRIYGLMEKGARKAEESMAKVGWIYWDDGWKSLPFERTIEKAYGPMWIGRLHDISSIKKMEKLMDKMKLENEGNIGILFSYFKKEFFLPPMYYESNIIASQVKGKQPKIEKLIYRLKNSGYQAGRCHFAFNAIKSNAPYSEIKKLYKREKKDDAK